MTFSRLRLILRHQIWRWLERRQPATPTLLLRQKHLYVLPTRFGSGLVLLVMLLYVLGTNYQNNLIMLLAYLLLVLLLGTILLAFQNLHHCVLNASVLSEVHAGTDVAIRLTLERETGPEAVDAGWAVVGQPTPLQAVTAESFVLMLPAEQRGYFLIPRLKLQSVYPFGLVRCWCYPQLECRYWVYPKPVKVQDPALNPATSVINDDWAGQRQYQPGDSLRQLDWKRFSRQQQMLVQQYGSTTALPEELWLSPDPRILSVEMQISALTAQALELHQRQQPFGLRCENAYVPVGTGPAHIRLVLQALALC